MVPLLVIGTLLTVAAPAPPVLGVVVAVLVGLLAFGVLSWGQRHQIRLAKRAAGPHGAADSTRAAISERGGDHYPVRDDLAGRVDRKSTRLNSSHVAISYAVFCLKKTKP